MKMFKGASVIALSFGLVWSVLSTRAVVPDLPPTNAPVVLNSWFFDNTTNWLLGSYGFPPLSYTNVTQSTNGDGYSLFLDNTNGAWLKYNVTENGGYTNLTVNHGTLMFWFAPNWSSTNSGGTGPGDWASLIEAGAYTTNASYGLWSLYVDPAGTNIYFSAQTNGAEATYLTAPIAWTNNYWHFIALAYSSTNSALYLDGALATNGLGVSYWPGPNVLSNGFFIGSDSSGLGQAHGTFDDIFTYDGPLDAASIGGTYSIYSIVYYGMPMSAWSLSNAPSSIEYTPTFTAITGAGYLERGTNATGCFTNSRVWITNLTASFVGTQSVTLTFGIAGGEEGATYDVFATSGLTDPITNGVWVWFGQSYHCTTNRVTITNPPPAVFLILGTPLDSDSDGLTDAYENLVSHTDPFNPDSDGQGLPDWWQWVYFGHLGVDPYADPDNDGWSNIEEYENGTNPNQFNTPPAPRGLAARYNGSLTNVLVSWDHSPGPLIGYRVEREIPELGTVDDFDISAGDIDFEDTPFPLTEFDPMYPPPTFRIRGRYLAGDSDWSERVPLASTRATIVARVTRGPQGQPYLVISAPPQNCAAIRLTRYDDSVFPFAVTNFDIAIGTFTNGVYFMPTSIAPVLEKEFQWYARTVSSNGQSSAGTFAGWNFSTPFFDGRAQLKQNLAFLLRAANHDQSFEYTEIRSPQAPYLVSSPTNYAYAGLHDADSSFGPDAYLEEFRPFDHNYVYRNFAFATTNLNSSGYLNTGVGIDITYDLVLQYPTKYLFQAPTSQVSIASVLASGESQWNYFYPLSTSWDLSVIGVSFSSPNYVMSSSARNIFGLPYVSAKLAWGSNASQIVTLTAGGSITAHTGYFYAETAQPGFQITNYYFGQTGMDWLPGHDEFSPTNTSPVLLASVGDPYFSVAGYAKLAITNGYSDKFGFLGQYFDKAYKLGTNGIATTNQTGILSEYGEFFPTESGPVALVTMPDPDTGQRGTGIVHVISLSTDANHDGTIDTSFYGPDFTSYYKPFRFWVNDDDDSGETGGGDISAGPGTHEKKRNGTDSQVNGVRDLIDFFPVYVNIQSFLQTLSTNQIQTRHRFLLRQQDSALNFFYPDLTPGTSHDYITQTNVASAQATAGVIPITADGVQLLNIFLYGSRSDNKSIILVEARTNSTNPLVLEIWDDTNLIAQTSLYLSVGKVEAMFREKNLIQAVWTNSTAGFADRLTDSGVQNEPDVNDKNFVFVQGYNVNPNQARGWSSEMFKRLYWSGSRAKFYGVTWLGYDTQRLLTSKWYGTPNFHTNVFHAFQTAPKLKEFVQTLTNGTVSAAFSLGNLAVLSAISDWGAHPAKHFMIDAAVPVEAIDGSSSINTNMIHPEWYLYTNRLYANEWFQLFPANDARSTLSWSNRVANLPLTNIYNFYSSGEEVLRTHVGSPPSIPGFVIGELLGAFDDVPMGTYTWAFQEKMKGRTQGNAVLGSNHGGWGFSTNPAYYTNFLYQDGWVTNRLGPAEVANVPAEQLRTNAFFQMTSSSFAADAALYGPSASAYAQANRERILSDAIPALTLPVGANAVPTLSLEQLGVERNFLMPDLFKNGWPSERPASGTEAGKWYHSDVREVAYTYIYKLFDEIVNDGNLE